MRTCEHYFCRCARAAELAAMGMTEEAIAVHYGRVRCRLACCCPDCGLVALDCPVHGRVGHRIGLEENR